MNLRRGHGAGEAAVPHRHAARGALAHRIARQPGPVHRRNGAVHGVRLRAALRPGAPHALPELPQVLPHRAGSLLLQTPVHPGVPHRIHIGRGRGVHVPVRQVKVAVVGVVHGLLIVAGGVLHVVAAPLPVGHRGLRRLAAPIAVIAGRYVGLIGVLSGPGLLLRLLPAQARIHAAPVAAAVVHAFSPSRYPEILLTSAPRARSCSSRWS